MKRTAMTTANTKVSKTKDAEFDELVVEFKKSHKQATNMQNSMRVSFNSWNALKKQLETALSNADSAFSNDTTGSIIATNAMLAKEKIDVHEVSHI
ncbi:hypothetical protein SARC_06782 [Sphaeroforma arctica JP610]|uniref:Uncharacterized protein n=1 Tax=Sphaeroforma arctica JP610 TaxID=667725 RepID=A0A0L0FY45_9EUKA|nr:hypothetical protein SARC_06782 [Sphaeroforma arctica JP610]KNC80883.1 hypothetical protein SARC_06782 [Sphaeroforma arctica JP610]|eukprot:XP_014154785.1 hypothetical protein SARC_06782 [Sphaeroforma arctica JP610]